MPFRGGSNTLPPVHETSQYTIGFEGKGPKGRVRGISLTGRPTLQDKSIKGHKHHKNSKYGKKSAAKRMSVAEELNDPLSDLVSRNWSLPRVELWCRDPGCRFNRRLSSSDIHTHPHPHHQLDMSHSLNPASMNSITSINMAMNAPGPNGPRVLDMSMSRELPMLHTLEVSAQETLTSRHSAKTNRSIASGTGSNRSAGTVSTDLASATNSLIPVGMDSRGSQTNIAYPVGPFVKTPQTSNPYCPSCNGIVPLNHVDVVNKDAAKTEPFWNFSNFHHPLQRDASFHSFGGFTLNGQYNTQVKKKRVVKFCSSHKIALVVSTFSILVTIGLIITLLLMKKRGMMETMST